jgi:hypothetical protein
MALRTLKSTVNVVFGAAIVGLILVGTSSADTYHPCGDHNVAKTRTHRPSQDHGSGRFVGFQAAQVIVPRFRFVSAEARRSTCAESNGRSRF